MKNIIPKKCITLFAISLLVFGAAGCTNQSAASPVPADSVSESSSVEKKQETENTAAENHKSGDMTADSFASTFYNTTDTAHFFRSLDGQTRILDFETMENVLLCNKPNCNHKSNDCIVNRLNGNVPMFSGTDTYYFIDDYPRIQEGDDGKPFLKLGSTLYRYDLTSSREEKLLYIEGVSVSDNCYGWLLHDGVIYFIGNHYSPEYDENGILTFYGNTGGKMELNAVDLSTMEIKQYGELYDLETLAQYYPNVKNSGEVYMAGVFDEKLYFNVGFAHSIESGYSFYVTWFDLNSKTYHGEPQDYTNIDYCSADFVSRDYLVITREGQADIYKAGREQTVTIKDDSISPWSFLSVFDDTLFLCEKAFDLNTKESKIIDLLKEKAVVAKYDDSYVISYINKQQDFEKIPASQLLNGK